MKRIENKVCISTGAGMGIGEACALRLGEAGARVALFDVQGAEWRATAERPQGYTAR